MVVEGKRWHPDCFKCGVCRKKIARGESFFEDEDLPGRVLCHACVSERCEDCKRVLEEDYVNFDGKKYHEKCFKCFDCKEKLDIDSFYKWKGRPYCQIDFTNAKRLNP